MRLARERDFDVILTDMRMPGHDGLETTRRIRALPGPRGHVPVVLVTADLAARDLETSGATGLTACLMKPFTRAGLLAATEAAARMTPPRITSPGTMAPDSPPASLLDGAILADLHASMGADAVEAHFQAAARRIEDLLTLLDTARAAGGAPVGDAVHDLVGVTGLLGLSALSACLRRFETHDDSATLSALRESAAGSLLALRRRQEAAAVH